MAGTRANASDGCYRIGFMMAQVAGHVTQYHNLRRITSTDPTIDPAWCEISYHRPGGRIEQFADRLGRGMALRPLLDLHRALRGTAFDAVFLNTSAADMRATPFFETPTMIDFDATPIQLQQMPEYGRTPGLRPVAHVRRRLKRRLWTGVQLLQAWSQWAKDSAVNDYGVPDESIVINPPGVDLDAWKPKSGSDPAERDAPHRVLFVGADLRRKGGDLLLDWYRRSRPRGVELHLVTREPVQAGDGIAVYDDIEPNSERLVRLYQQSDVFVLPSRAECFGIATVEALATGLPVVVSDVGASADIVEHERNGYVVRPGSAGDLGAAISEILADEDRRRQMAAASRAIAEARFDLETNAQRTLLHLKRLAAGLPVRA